MGAIKIVAIVLMLAGTLGLAYGGFTYVSDSHSTTLGPIEMKVTDKDWFNIPIWAGVGSIVLGGVLFFVSVTRNRG